MCNMFKTGKSALYKHNVKHFAGSSFPNVKCVAFLSSVTTKKTVSSCGLNIVITSLLVNVWPFSLLCFFFVLRYIAASYRIQLRRTLIQHNDQQQNNDTDITFINSSQVQQKKIVCWSIYPELLRVPWLKKVFGHPVHF